MRRFVRRRDAVRNDDAVEAADGCLTGAMLHTVLGGDTGEENSLDASEAHQLLKVGAEEDVGGVLVQDYVALDWRQG